MVDLLILLAIVTLWSWLSASLSRRVAEEKGRSPDEGYWLGMMLGAFGLLVEVMLPAGI